MSKAFNPNDGVIKVQGREYLPVASRILWFRREFPEWSIMTDAVTLDFVKEFAVFRCTILNETGRVMATATKMEDKRGFPDFLEKAETGSVGRALAFLGYGTLGAKDFVEGDRLADAPLPQKEPEDPELSKARKEFRLIGTQLGTSYADRNAVTAHIRELVPGSGEPSLLEVSGAIDLLKAVAAALVAKDGK
jgi:hypothetical protein